LKDALVIHPMMSFYAGAEYLCLTVCEALQGLGYRVTLASHSFNPSEFDRIYGLGNVMLNCNLVSIPQFRPTVPHLQVIQRLDYSRRVWRMFRNTDADVVFSTQSSPFIVPRRMFHFVYSAGDLFSYPHAAAPLTVPVTGSPLSKFYVDGVRRAKKLLWGKQPSRDWFFALGSSILRDIRKRGYNNSSIAFPPCRVSFRPRFPKKKQVIQAARIIPDKRLELYFEIASRLPDYRFILVGKNDQLSDSAFPGYAKRILSRLPRNVIYVDALMRDRPELLEESKIYLYTGNEPGIGLAMVEAMAAGCVPFSPVEVGAADVLRVSGVGELYRTIDEAVAKISILMERELDHEEINTISESADRFSSEAFKKWIKQITNLDDGIKVPDSWPA
jgi:glycosyltransferase involved in cell wall biosynthesis